jgi:hypothetical protein
MISQLGHSLLWIRKESFLDFELWEVGINIYYMFSNVFVYQAHRKH